MTSCRPALHAAVLAGVLLLASCSASGSGSSPSETPPSTTPASTTSSPSGPGTSSSSITPALPPTSTEASGPTPTSTVAPKTGCTRGSAQIPGGAVSRPVIDVDGDGRADTSWIVTVDGATQVGIATAAGGGSRISYESASPIARSVLVANADERGPAEMIVSDGRGASLYAFVDCKIQPVRNVQGETYQFDLEDLRGHGTGIGCISTSKGRRLAGLQVDDRTPARVAWTSTVIDLDGLRARNGAQRSGSYDLPAEQARADLLDQITCGDRTMTADGITEQG